MNATTLPKCLLRLNGRPLLDYQLTALIGLNLSTVTICIGYLGEMIRDYVYKAHLPLQVRWVENPHWATTNNSYTLALALRKRREDDILIINGDNLLDPRIYRILTDSSESLLPYIVKSRYDAEDMKITYASRQGHYYLTRISKEIPVAHCHGESIGIRRFDPRFTAVLHQELETLVSSEEGRSSYWPQAIQRTIERGIPLRVLDVSGCYYADIDFERDLKDAKGMVRVVPLDAFLRSPQDSNLRRGDEHGSL